MNYDGKKENIIHMVIKTQSRTIGTYIIYSKVIIVQIFAPLQRIKFIVRRP